jgi:predicted TIM-barrel fold metal-dependent hydrolase
MSDRLVIVSLDGHVCPRVEVFRPYVEAKYLEQFDAFAAASGRHMLTLSATRGTEDAPSELRDRWVHHVEQTYGSDDLNADPSRRLSEMDADGIAAEALYHGGFNLHPIPFFDPDLHSSFNQTVPASGQAAELRAAGIRSYNRWLADFVGVAPERLVGVAHIPTRDVAMAVGEVERAREAGLRGVNLPSPRRDLMSFNRPEYDALWAVCADREMSLHTHGGGGDIFPVGGQGAWAIFASESRFLSRRGLAQLIFGGVFERFPRLSFFLTEQTDRWVAETLLNLDSIYLSTMVERTVPFIRDVLPRLPSDSFRSNCYIGASFMSRSEAEAAIEHDYWRNVMWAATSRTPKGRGRSRARRCARRSPGCRLSMSWRCSARTRCVCSRSTHARCMPSPTGSDRCSKPSTIRSTRARFPTPAATRSRSAASGVTPEQREHTGFAACAARWLNRPRSMVHAIRRDERGTMALVESRTGILVVMTDAFPDRHDEYNDWYEHTHVDDVLKVDGIAVAQRFATIPGLRGEMLPQRYMALYELSGDVDAVLESMRRTRPQRPTSPTLDQSTAASYAFRAIGGPHERVT